MRLLGVLATLLCLLASLAGAQNASVIHGRVVDSAGANISGAHVVVTNEGTGFARSMDTGVDGTYRTPDLDLANYKVQVTKAGFGPRTVTGIVLELGVSPAINVTLQAGAQATTVQAAGAMLETGSSSVGEVISQQQVTALPLNGRQATDLVALTGAAVNASAQGTANGNINSLNMPNAVTYATAGSTGAQTNFTLDGAPNMDYRTNVGMPMPFPDTLGAMRVQSSDNSASSGSRPGGSVGAVTKSGTNQFHGDIFEFFRNGYMNAKAFQVPAATGITPKGVQDNLKRSQFGGIIGGPIKKGKLYFFYGFQMTQERSKAPSLITGVPTPATLKGDFTTYLAPPCQSKTLYLNSTVPSPVGGAPQQLTTAPNSNMILPQWLNTPSAQVAARAAALLATPYDGCGDYQALKYNHNREYQNVGRLDWQRTRDDRIFARYSMIDYNLLSWLTPGNLLSSSGIGSASRAQNAVFGDTRTFTGHFVNTLRVSYVRQAVVRTSNDNIPNVCALGVNGYCPVGHFYSLLYNLPGFLGYVYQNVYGISESVSWREIHKHALSFGLDFQFVQLNADGVYQMNPGLTFSTGSSSYTGYNVADFVTGNADSLSQGPGQLARDTRKQPAFWVSDNWKVARNFTVSLGARWEPFFPQQSKYGLASDFNLDNYKAGVFSKVYANAPPGITFPGDPGFNGNADIGQQLNRVSPKVGFVWDPTGTGKTSIRGGYGLSYDTSVMWNTMHTVLNPPFGGATYTLAPSPVNVSDPANGGGLANPWWGVAGGNPFPAPAKLPSNIAFRNNGTYVFQDTHLQPASTQTWNLVIQRQITKDWMASATYIGNHGSNLWVGNNVNPAVVISAGMQMPGIVSTTGMTGTSGPCTLMFKGTPMAWSQCNAPSTVSQSGVNNEQARRYLTLLNPTYGPLMGGGVTAQYDYGHSNYDAAVLTVQHRMANHFSVTGNFTWSHCLNMGTTGQDISGTYQNPANPRADYGNCTTDTRFRFSSPIVASVPKFQNHLVNKVAGNWNVSFIFAANTGLYTTVTDGADVSLIGVNPLGGASNDRPNLVGDPNKPGPVAANSGCVAPTQLHTLRYWYNPCAFMVQPSTTFGSVGKQTMLNPGAFNLDTAVSRTFKPFKGEAKSFDLRGEAFNVLNHLNWGAPQVTVYTGTPGRIGTALNSARILQVALKFNF